MASRLGLFPWERDRLAPAELKELWDGYVWRRSRDMEVWSRGLYWLRSMMDPEADDDKIVESMPGYDGERERMIRRLMGGPDE